MNIAQRHRVILERIQEKDNVTIIGLSKHLDVSPVTIRKDIRLLEEKNLVFRKYGRAFAKTNDLVQGNETLQQKLSVQKTKMARAAMLELKTNDTVMVAAGNCLWHWARSVPQDLSLTVVTSSLEVAAELLDRPKIELVQLAGALSKETSSVIGLYAERGLQNLNFNTLLLEVDGIDLIHGLTMGHAAEAHLARHMVERSKKVVVLVDSSRLGQVTFTKVCGLDSVHHIITDRKASPELVEKFRKKGITVTLT